MYRDLVTETAYFSLVSALGQVYALGSPLPKEPLFAISMSLSTPVMLGTLARQCAGALRYYLSGKFPWVRVFISHLFGI